MWVRNKLLKIKGLLLKYKSKTLFRFLLAGTINTLFGILVNIVFLTFLPFHFSISIFLATCLGIIFNYFMSLKYVFMTPSSTLRIAVYILVYFLMYLANIFFMSFLISQFNLSNLISYIICAPFTITLTYILQKKIVFPDEEN
jgi:putative flippase GtrA